MNNGAIITEVDFPSPGPVPERSVGMSSFHKQCRIFVVDDEEIIATTLAMILRNSGFDTIPFTCPVRALEASRSESPDLLISDVVMPKINGIELAIQIQLICPNCKVLLFSGQASTQDLLDSALYRRSGFEVIAKPVHPTDLLRKIRDEFGTD
jgi:DNA-binding NtrC family response regulator